MLSIKRKRKELGVPLNELARRTGIHRENLARAERDGIDPRASTLAAIARGLGVPVCELFGPKEGVSHAKRRRVGR